MKKLNIPALFALLTILFSFPSRTPAQPPPINPATAAQYFQEAQDLCGRDKGKLWGTSLCAPLLFVDRQTRTVIANQADREGILAKEGTVYTGHLPAQINIANTAVEWAGVRWTMVIYPLPDDKVRRADLLAHEMWHRVQNELGFPGSGAANNHLDSRDGRVWLQLEWRALAAALTSRGSERNRAISDALLFRAYRRTLFPNAAAEEREMEMHEGLAEYTGVVLSGSPNVNQFIVGTNLREAPQKETFVRSFAYASGPAYGVLLDQAKARWRQNLKKENDLGILLQAKLSIKLPEDLKQAAGLRARAYDGDALQASETGRENARQKLLAGYRARLVDGPVLALPLQKMNMQFNPGNLLPLDALGTVYPDIRIVDVWGILTVTKNGALMNPTFSRITVPAPVKPHASPLEGDGWTLELNPGWQIVKGARAGDYKIVENS